MPALSAAQTPAASEPATASDAGASPQAEIVPNANIGAKTGPIVLVLPLASASFSRAAEAVQAGFLAAAEAAKAPFCITGEYARWKSVLRKELDPIKAMMQKKLELKGQMTTIVKYVNASKELVECATRVPTAFLDEK